MNCPVCNNSLTPVQAGHVTVDVCAGGCGGVWFDNFELQKLDEPHESGGHLLGNIAAKAGLQIDHASKRNCPKCGDIIMMRHFFSARREVEVDEYPNCGGYWLDAGELALIRAEHQTDREQQMAVEQYVEEISTKSLEPSRLGGRTQAERARRITQVLRFTIPVRYRT